MYGVYGSLGTRGRVACRYVHHLTGLRSDASSRTHTSTSNPLCLKPETRSQSAKQNLTVATAVVAVVVVVVVVVAHNLTVKNLDSL